MSDQIIYKDYDINTEFTVRDLQLFIDQIVAIEGVEQNTVIDSIRLKFTNNLPCAFLDEAGELVIYD